MKCAICSDYDQYRVYFVETGKLVRYCAKHGEVYIRLQMKFPNKYKVYSSSDLTRYTNKIIKSVKGLMKKPKPIDNKEFKKQ